MSATEPLTTARATWRLVRFRPWLYALEMATSTAYECTPLLTGLILRAFFDRLSGSAAVGLNLPTLLALLIATEGVRIVALLVGNYSWATGTYTYPALLRRNILDWTFRGLGPRPRVESPGETVNRLRDDADELYSYLETYLDVVPTAFRTVVALAIMVAINPVVTLMVCLPLAAIVAVTNALGARLRAYRERSREATGRVTGFIGELFAAVQTIKVGGAEERAGAHFDRLSAARGHAALRDTLLTSLLSSFNGNVVTLGTAITLLLIGSSLQLGSFTVGDLALFITYLEWTTELPFWIGEVMTRHKQAGVAVARLMALLPGAPPATLVTPAPVYLTGPLPTVPPIARSAADRLDTLDVVGLAARHGEGGRGVAGIDLRIARGSVVVVTGRVGAGKTALLRALLGLLPRAAGEIRWNGEPVADPAVVLVPPRVAYTPQVPQLFSTTLRDNILLGQQETASSLGAAVALATLEADVAAMPHGLDTTVGPRGVRLSGGQIQRAAAARMFARDAELLVIDDLSSALDVATERVLWDRLFAARAAGAAPTCLIVSHRREVLRRADWIVVLEEGRVVAQGQLADLLTTSAALRRIWQAEEEPGEE